MEEILKAIFNSVDRYLFGAFGAVCAFLEPTVPLILTCTLAVSMDCWMVWSLSRRVRKKFLGANDGKFKSNYAGRVFVTLVKVYALIVPAFLIQAYILEGSSMKLVNIVTGAVCFWQVRSMPENESSCNDSRWAKVARRIMVGKTERHFDIDLHELKRGGDNGKC